ncbi:MAG: surface lipoprotein assembly modifier [Litoreibacter sp.]|uniref:surface lipoprotein assembly modifier n=1 Tax=Litoreibacter sp. TaxID=1969459 RepID=UPI0032975CE2
MRRALMRVALACGIATATIAPSSALAQRVTVSLDQAHNIGLEAFKQRNYKLSYSVAKQLLQAREDDIGALILLAASAPHVGEHKEGRIAARKAYLKSKNPTHKLNAATYAAVAAAKEKRPLLTQLWLRRAYQQAESDAQRTAIGNQYRQYSRTSPVKLSFAVSVSPSSNLNGGSESQFLTIDGAFPIGILNGAAQALSGLRAQVRGRLTYTLSEEVAHKTTLTFAGNVSRVRLSSGARALAPTVSNSDLGDTELSARITHQIAHQGRPIPDTYSFALGQTWFGGDEYYSYATASLGRSFRFGKKTRLNVSATHTHQIFAGTQSDIGVSVLRFNLARQLQNRDVLRASFSLSDSQSDSNNSVYQSYSASLGYQLGKPIGPASLSANVSYSETTYDNYRIGFIQVPGGRKDQTTHAKLDMTFNDISYMGFVPQMNISHIRTTSNISRFERKTTGVGFSFVSAF